MGCSAQIAPSTRSHAHSSHLSRVAAAAAALSLLPRADGGDARRGRVWKRERASRWTPEARGGTRHLASRGAATAVGALFLGERDERGRAPCRSLGRASPFASLHGIRVRRGVVMESKLNMRDIFERRSMRRNY